MKNENNSKSKIDSQTNTNDIEMLLSSYDCNSTAVYKRQLN